MIVKFKSVEATNFRSFKQFSLDLTNAGTTLVRGKIEGGSETLESNGAGKSSIFSALSFALFGKIVHVSGSKVSGDKVVRRSSQNEGCHVSVSLSTEEHELEITRYRSHPTHGDKIYLVVDGSVATQSSNPKTQQMIEALLGITPELFFNLIYISEATLRESFAFESDAQRKKILVGALPQFQQFNKARAAVKDSLSQYTESIKKLEAELNAHEMALSELKNAQVVDTSAVETRIAEIGGSVQSSLKEQLIETIKSMEGDVEKSGHNLPVLMSAMHQRQKVLTKLQYRLSRAFEEQKRLKKLIEKFASLSGVCPTCEEPISSVRCKFHENEYRSTLGELENRINLITDLCGIAMDRHLNASSMYQTAQVGVLEKQDRIKHWKHELQQVNNRIHSESAELKRLKQFLNQVKSTHIASELRVKELEIRVNELNSLILTAKQFEAALKNWLDGFGPRGVVSHGLNQVLEILTEKTEKWLWKLWHEGASFQFEIIGDDLSKIEAKLFLNRVLVDVESLSSGETRRLCLAICFGLREALQTLVGWRSNLLVLDEVFDGLDSVGRIKVLHELQTLTDTNAFVISQFPQLGEDINHIIDVTFSSGISTLKQS